ncbi:hypothetical protein Slin14017_G116490 [Septoria linicola]|nr:hypothetical protein Slin14017_G116490 [Septoria linicola]
MGAKHTCSDNATSSCPAIVSKLRSPYLQQLFPASAASCYTATTTSTGQACTTEEGYVNDVGNDYLDASEFLFTQTFTEEDFMAEPFDLENDADVAEFMTYFQASTPPGERAQLEDAPGAKAVEGVFKPAGAEAMSRKDGDHVFKDLVEW